MPGVNWKAFWPPTPRLVTHTQTHTHTHTLSLSSCVYVVCSNLGYQLGTGGDLLPVVDSLHSDGIQKVFATNLFGHFIMVYTNLPVTTS